MRRLTKKVLAPLLCLVMAFNMTPHAYAAGDGGDEAASYDYGSLYSEYGELLADIETAASGEMGDEAREALLVRRRTLSLILYGDAGNGLTDEQFDALSALDLEIYLKLKGESIMMDAPFDPDAEDGVAAPMAAPAAAPPEALVAQPTPISVTVPSTIAISVDEYGVTTAADFAITNNSVGDVRISSLCVTAENGWQLKDYGAAFMVNEKAFALKINGDDMADGFEAEAAGAIGRGRTLALPVEASVATQTTSRSDTIGSIVFVMGWVGNGPLVDIQITAQPSKTAYKVGDTFDAAGMVVTAIYADGTGEVVTGFAVSPTTMAKDTTEVSVAYAGFTKTVGVTVDRVLTGIEITARPSKTTYNHGDAFDATGMVVTAIYTDGSEAVTGYAVSPTAMNYGTSSVTVSYGGYLQTVPVTVNRVLESIAVTKKPAKTTYNHGDTFDATGMVVTATYTDGGAAAVTGYACSNISSLPVGSHSVTITYNGKAATVAITIESAFDKAPIGSVVTGGTFRINGVVTAPAIFPYSSSYTDDYAGDGRATGNLPSYNRSYTYTFGDSEGKGKDLQWVKVSDKLFIADRNLLCDISWDNIKSLGFMYGSKTVTIEGRTYKIRLISSGGSEFGSDDGGEWNKYISDRYGAGGTDIGGAESGWNKYNSNRKWHWEGCYSWCLNPIGYKDNAYVIRGFISAAGWNFAGSADGSWTHGFRPALELVR